MSDDPPPESAPSLATDGGDRDPAEDGPPAHGDGDPAGGERAGGDAMEGSNRAGGNGAATDHGVVEEDGEAGDNGDASGEEGGGLRSVPWLYLLGLLVFVASLGAFLWDLATGHAIERSLVTNALGAVVLVSWAGYDSYRDSHSGVATRGGAVGTGLILVGIYLFVGGIVVTVTALIHGRTILGLAMIAGAVPLVLVGFLSYPTEDVLAEREVADESGTTRPGDRADEEA